MIFYIALISLLTIAGLAYFPVKKRFNVGKFFVNLLLVILIIFIPLTTFLLSAFLAPEWKGGAALGSLSLLYITKIYLLPFVLWAVAALYTVEVVRPQKTDSYWLLLGLFSGAVVSVLIFLFVLIDSIQKKQDIEEAIIIIIAGPGYVAIWYILRFWKLFKLSKLNKITYLYTVMSQLPFWGYSLYTSKQKYLSLSDNRPECFVITASSKGFPIIVGELTIHKHNNRNIYASKQMLRFWQFENIWAKKHPVSHKKFRNIYNLLGKKLACHINTPLRASASFILLKPVEWLLLIILIINQALRKQS